MPADLQVLIRHIRRVAGRTELAKLTDRELLARYAQDRDDASFSVLVARHAALVAGVCRRVLRNEQDVEDVFQATFVVLSRKAGAVQARESSAGWLHRVAFHLALEARKEARRRQRSERDRQLLQPARGSGSGHRQSCELQEVLDEELARLPESCRTSLILCYLEGRTRDQAARLSGWSVRTLDRRLERGRELLRERLARRNLELSVIVLAAALAEPAPPNCARMTLATVEFVRLRATSKASEAISALRLLQSTLSGVSGKATRIAFGTVLAIALTGAGVGLWGSSNGDWRHLPIETSAAENPKPQAAKSAAPKPGFDLDGNALPPGAVARLGSLRFRVGFPETIAYSPDGKILFAGSQAGIRMFDASTGHLLRTLGQELKTTCWTTAVSPDGKLAAIGGMRRNPGEVVYETASGNRICTLQSPTPRSTRFGGFSPDGSVVATTVHSSRVDLYNARTGELLHKLEWERDPNFHSTRVIYGDVAFMPDGKTLLISTRSSGIIRAFDVQNGAELRHFTATPNGMAGMKLSPDGTRLAVIESTTEQFDNHPNFEIAGAKVRIFDPITSRQVSEFQTQKPSPLALAFARDGKTLYAGKDGRGIGIWETETGKRAGSLPTAAELTNVVAVAPDGKTFAIGDFACVHICDAKTGEELQPHADHTRSIRSLALHPLGSTVATGGDDGRLFLWDGTTGQMLREVTRTTGSVSSLAFSPDGHHLYGAVRQSPKPESYSIRCWNSSTGKEVWSVDDRAVQSKILTISPNGKVLATLGNSAGVLVEAETGKPIRALEGGQDIFPNSWWSTGNLAFTPDGNHLLTMSSQGALYRWETATGEHHVQKCDIDESVNNVVAFSPDRTQVIVGGLGLDHLSLVDVASGKRIRDLKTISARQEDYLFSTAFSPDGRTVAWGGPIDCIVRLVDVETGLLRRELNAINITCALIAFSNDGKTLVTASDDGTALVWDLAKGAGAQ
jgi:RNA polymerase sigma factor (sigma-70 family)